MLALEGRARGALLVIAAVLSASAGAASAATGDESVAYQVNPAHSGAIANAGLAPPLAQQWSVTLPGAVSYPLIVNGAVFVTTADKTVYALNQASGSQIWSHSVGGTYPWSGLAYDRGQLFVLNNGGLLTAFDPATGSVDWSQQLPGQYMFSSAPTAVNGIVYVSGAGVGGTVYATRESDGRLLWTQPVENGDDSSPAVDAQAVYVSYACGQDYAFARLTGTLLWHHTGPCEGGGGKTAVVASDTVFARDNVSGNLMLSTATGAVVGAFNAGPAPAVANDVAYMLSGSTLKAIANAGQGSTSWQFSGDGNLDSAPLVVANLVFVGSSLGALYALNAANGTTSWSTNVGNAIPGPDEQNVSQPLTGLGAANGTLVVPAGNTLVAYRTSGAITVAPTNQTAPTIDGVPQVGQIAAADVGIWSGLPTGYAYQWELCDGTGGSCSNIAGAANMSYKPTADQAGSTLRVKVTATNANGSSAPVESSASPAILEAAPVNQTAPSISGTAQEDQTLNAGPGTWSGNPTDFTYQWRRCDLVQPLNCLDIAGATNASYTVVADDVGFVLRVRVVATNAGGQSDPVDSLPTAAVLPAAPVNETLPSIDGFAEVGELLFADPGTWTSHGTTSYAYQWFTCDAAVTSCPDVQGATQDTYLVRPEDLGRYIGLEVVATNSGGDSDPADSDLIGPVVPSPPVNRVAPTLTGTAQQGQTLVVNPGGWDGSPTSFTYYWYSCDGTLVFCVEVPGATGSTYRIGAGDVGRRLIAGVIATNAGGDSDEELTQATDPVMVAAPTNQLAPNIAGRSQQGQTLTATPGSWTNNPTAYSYQWTRCNASGIGCTNISGATSITYQPAAADIGARLVVAVVAVNAGGKSAPALSGPTDIVLPALSTTFTRVKTAVAPDGGIRLYLRSLNPGGYTATATASRASLAPRPKGCRRTCRTPRGTSVYASGSTAAAQAGTTVLRIKPTARARWAITHNRLIRVHINVTFRSALGGSPSSHTYLVTVRGRHGRAVLG